MPHSFEPDEIEIHLNDVQIAVSLGFKIQKADWEAMSDEQKREFIGNLLDTAATQITDDLIPVRDINGQNSRAAFLVLEIMGPTDDEIDLSSLNIYDPETE